MWGVDGVYSAGVTDEDVKTEYGYDQVGNRTVITDARLNVTSYVYDDLNRRIEMRDPLNHLTQYGYDGVGNRTSLTDANGVVTTFTYDNVNRLTGIDYGDTTPDVSFTYDGAGNRTSMSDGVGQTLYTYDDLYRLTAVSQPSASGGPSAVVGYEYDPVGNRTKLIYPDSREVNYSYDPGNRLETVTDWHNGQFGYNYDEANRLTAVALPNTLSGTGGVTSDYAYDDAGRLTLLAHSTLTETIASYDYSLDKVGNRRVLTEALVTVENLPAGAYLESDGLVVLEAENGDRTNGTTHNWLLQTATSGYTGTSYLNTSLDNDTLYQTGEITASPKAEYLVDFTTTGTYTVWLRGYPANAASDSAYVGVGDEVTEVTGFSPAEWSWANVTLNNNPATLPVTSTGIYTLSLFMREDGLRIDRLLLTTDTNYIPTGFGPPETERYAAGMALPTVPVTRTIVYTYDNLYRLTDADYSTGEAYDYEYDPVGNRLKQIIDGDTTDYLYDAANRLASVDGQSYTFDDNGNLLATGVMTNTWGAANRLINSINSTNSLTPIYNGVNDRVGQTVDGNTTDFALDIAGGLPEVIYTSEGNAYLHLPGVIVAESAAGETRYLLSDGLGSVRQGVDENGAVVAYNEFDPYGNPTLNAELGTENYGFTGEWWQVEVGLLHLRARWYSPKDGVFLSKDAWEGDVRRSQSMNGWSYVEGNPINWVDPSGYQTTCPAEGYCPEIDRLVCGPNTPGRDEQGRPCVVDPNVFPTVTPTPTGPTPTPAPTPTPTPTPCPTKTPNGSPGCKVEVFSYPAALAKGNIFLGRHLFIVHTGNQGQQTVFEGYPDPDNENVLFAIFYEGFPPQVSGGRNDFWLRGPTIAKQGEEACELYNCLRAVTLDIQGPPKIPYYTFSQNSNSFVHTVLKKCSLPSTGSGWRPWGYHPGDQLDLLPNNNYQHLLP